LSEHTEQVAVVAWFRMQHPKQSKLLFSHIDGAIIGGKNKFGAISNLKKEGWTKGIPDLMLAYPVPPYSGLWIEMKDKNKSEKDLRPEQKEYLELFNSVGYAAYCCCGFDHAKHVIQMYLNGDLPHV